MTAHNLAFWPMAARCAHSNSMLSAVEPHEIAQHVNRTRPGGKQVTWNLSGRGLEICSCKTFCPCWLTADVEPDEGWCAAVFAWDSKEGTSDGVDLAGVKFALLAEWPANFHKGGGKARLYVDTASSADQQAELQAIFEGQREGPAQRAPWDALRSAQRDEERQLR